MLDAPAWISDKNGRRRKLDSTEAAFFKLRDRGLVKDDLKAQLKILDYGAQRHEEELAREALAERRALEERELALLIEALPRLQARIAAIAG